MSIRDPDDHRVHCTWQNIARCPLYIASHEPYGLGCVDDLAEPCKVARGEISYQAAVERLIAQSFAGLARRLDPIPVSFPNDK